MAPRKVAPQFQFVNISNPEQSKDVASQKLIRSHVLRHNSMKQSRQRLSQHATPEGQDNGSSTDASAGVTRSRPKNSKTALCECSGKVEDLIAESKNSGQLLIVEDCSRCGRTSLALKAQPAETGSALLASAIAQMAYNSGLKSQLGISRSDPFASYAAAMSTGMHGLLDHLVSVMTPTLSPVDKKYASRTNTPLSYQYTISHPAVLHATLAASSMHLGICSRDPQAAISTATHRGEAIRLVNRMLEDEKEATSDEMIGCVVRLSSYEIFSGDHNGWKAHANALKEIVCRRGGLQNLGLRGGIKRQCYESDLMGSMIGGTCPVFSPCAGNSVLSG